MKNLITWMLYIAFVLVSQQSFSREENPVLNRDGERIITALRAKYVDYKARGYMLPPSSFQMLMASWLPYNGQINYKTMQLSWQHDSRLFEFIGQYVENHICKTKTGSQLCRIYLKKVNQQSSTQDNFSKALAKHLILAVSEERKILDSWSSNFIVWLFVDPNEITVASLNRWMIHEMFQVIDIKNALAGVVAAAKELNDPLLCAVSVGNLNREIRFASSAIRSYKIEDSIMSELTHKNHELLSHLRQRSCEFNLEWTHIQLGEFYENLRIDAYSHLIDRVPQQCFTSIVNEAVVSRTNFDFAKKLFKDNPEACEFLSEPNLDQIETLDIKLDFLDTWFHGPRPRVGGV